MSIVSPRPPLEGEAHRYNPGRLRSFVVTLVLPVLAMYKRIRILRWTAMSLTGCDLHRELVTPGDLRIIMHSIGGGVYWKWYVAGSQSNRHRWAQPLIIKPWRSFLTKRLAIESNHEKPTEKDRPFNGSFSCQGSAESVVQDIM